MTARAGGDTELMSFLARVAIVVDDYDAAIAFVVDALCMRAYAASKSSTCQAAGVEFVGMPRTETYGRVAVFRDIAGNRWDLLGPA